MSKSRENKISQIFDEVGRGSSLSHALGLRHSLGAASRLTHMLLLSYLALMFLVLKFVYRVTGTHLGNIKVSHLLSAHIACALPCFIRLLTSILVSKL